MVAASVIDAGIDDEVIGAAPEVKDRLAAYFAEVASGLVRSEQRRGAELYARGLMEAGGRKSLEPMVGRLGGGSVEYEALQHFVADSPWDPGVIDRAVAERVCAVIEPAAWVLDDTGVLKDGRRSPGVKRQYSGTLGKIGNCRALLIEALEALLAANRPRDCLVLTDRFRHGRIRLAEARARLTLRDVAAAELLLEDLVIEDLREGEATLHELWFEIHGRDRSPPRRLDFRMRTD